MPRGAGSRPRPASTGRSRARRSSCTPRSRRSTPPPPAAPTFAVVVCSFVIVARWLAWAMTLPSLFDRLLSSLRWLAWATHLLCLECRTHTECARKKRMPKPSNSTILCRCFPTRASLRVRLNSGVGYEKLKTRKNCAFERRWFTSSPAPTLIRPKKYRCWRSRSSSRTKTGTPPRRTAMLASWP